MNIKTKILNKPVSNLSVILLLSLAATLTSLELNAQFQLKNGDVVDRIVAIVGNEIILQSDIDALILDNMNRGGNFKLNDDELRKKILDEYIEEKILITKATEDSVAISDEMVEERWDMTIQRLLQLYGSTERIEAVYKKTINHLRLEAREDIRKRLMAQQLEMTKFNNVTASSKEVEEFYEKMKDSLPMIPVQVELYHIVKYITPDTLSRNNTINKAREIRDSIMAGGDFADFATRYSEDPGSAQDGGKLGWVARGRFVPEFERAAFALHPSQISMPVESPFGFHLIQLLEKNRDSINCSHILFKLIQSEADIAKVRIFLDSIRQIAIDSNNFDALALLHSDDRNTRGFGGLLGKFMLSDIPLSIASTVRELQENEISQPIPFSDDPTKQGMSIVWNKRLIPEHRATLAEDYDYLKRVATHYKIMELRNKWIAELKQDIYWEIFK